MTTYYATIVNRRYTGPSVPVGAQHPGQVFNVIYGKKPNGTTWIRLSHSGFKSDPGSRLTVINEASTEQDMYKFLEKGGTLILPTLTPFDDQVTYGAIPGNGCLHAPGLNPDATLYTVAPFDDPNLPNAIKDFAMLIQHLRFHAAELGIDVDKLGGGGRSGAGGVAGALAGPDLKGNPGIGNAPGTQEQESTRLVGYQIYSGQYYWQEFEQQTFAASPPFPKTKAKGAITGFEPCGQLENTYAQYQLSACSADGFAFGTVQLRQMNSSGIKFYLKGNGNRYVGTGSPNDSYHSPFPVGATDKIVAVHDSWHEYGWNYALRQRCDVESGTNWHHIHSRFVVTNCTNPDGTEDITWVDNGNADDDWIAWMEAELGLGKYTAAFNVKTPTQVVIKHGAHLQQLMPRGSVWTRQADANLTKLLYGFAVEHGRMEGRVNDLLREMDPGMAVELLADWERIAGLPSKCTGPLTSVPLRQAAVVARLFYQGGQSITHFVQLAAVLGFVISIEEFRPFRCGLSHCGDVLSNGTWIFVWKVHAPVFSVAPFLCGRSGSGDRLLTWGNGLLTCQFDESKPAHTQVEYEFDGDYVGYAPWGPWVQHEKAPGIGFTLGPVVVDAGS